MFFFCILTGFFMSFFSLDAICQSISSNSDPCLKENVFMKIVYDNYLVDHALIPSWGFACVVEISTQTILFDTGGNSDILLSNMEKMNIDPEDIDAIFISHIHSDHLGGLAGFLDKNHDVTVYIPPSFPIKIRNEIVRRGARYQDIGEFARLFENVYSTGPMGLRIREQSLIIDTIDGLVVITGCAHPGIVKIVKSVKRRFPEKKIVLVMGGFHLSGASEAELLKIVLALRNTGVQRVAPSHCSGDRCRDIFHENFTENYIDGGLGKVIQFIK